MAKKRVEDDETGVRYVEEERPVVVPDTSSVMRKPRPEVLTSASAIIAEKRRMSGEP